MIILFKMYFWLKCFCFILILIQIDAEYQKLNFSVATLSNSRLAIFWHQNNTGEKRDTYLKFDYRSVGGKYNDTGSRNVSFVEKQFLISSLKESTSYRINITEYFSQNNSLVSRYTENGNTTSVRTGLKPEKPDFKLLQQANYSYSIFWIPCGNTSNCSGIGGTHFHGEYRHIGSREWQQINTAGDSFYNRVFLLPGRKYEISVSAKTGDYRSEIRAKKVSIPPASCPVEDVKMKTLSNSSVMISWSPINRTVNPVTAYYVIFNETKAGEELYIDGNNFTRNNKIDINKKNGLEPIVVNKTTLMPKTNYTIFIIPLAADGRLGSDYSFYYTFNQENSTTDITPLKKPKFNESMNCQVALNEKFLDVVYEDAKPDIYRHIILPDVPTVKFNITTTNSSNKNYPANTSSKLTSNMAILRFIACIILCYSSMVFL